MIFKYINEYETRKFKFLNGRECVIVPISGDEYAACENPNMWCTRDDTPTTRGLANSKKDPNVVERVSRLAECACSKLFGVEVNFDRVEGGDNGIDFTFNGKSFDIKTSRNLEAARKHKKNFIKATGRDGKLISLHADVYISSFILSENKDAKEASVVLVGWVSKGKLKKLHENGLHVSPRWAGQMNYELRFLETNPILPLVEKIREANERAQYTGA